MQKPTPQILTKVIAQDHMWKTKLFNCWHSIIGSMNSKVRIESISKDCLVLGVCHPAWAQELVFLTPMLKKKINETLQEERIKTIHFKTVDFSKRKLPTTINDQPIHIEQQTEVCEHCFTFMEHSALQSVASDELRNELAKFYVRCQKRNSVKPKPEIQ